MRLLELDAPPPSMAESAAPIAVAEPSDRVAARKNFLKFVEYVFPGYRTNWHHRILCDALERFARGTCKRLIIRIPPQAGGKSTLACHLLPAWILGNWPDSQIIEGASIEKLAMKNIRKAQRFMLSTRYFELFPNVRLKSNSGTRTKDAFIQTAHEFEVVGHAGGVMAAGVNGNVTGNPATHLIGDDLIKGRKDADSPTVRDSTFDWLEDEATPRVGASGGICLIGTAWHDDEPAARKIKAMEPDADGEMDPDAEFWEVISLPARFEYDSNPKYKPHPKDPRKEGETLWDWYYAGKKDGLSKKEEAEKAKAYLKKWEKRNPRGFASLGQQRPTPREGVLIKWEWFQMVTAVARVGDVVRYWDLAGTAKDVKKKNHDPDYSAGAAVQALPDKRRALLDVARERLDVGARDVWILDVAREDKKRYGARIKWYIETEGGIGGVQRTKKLIRDILAVGVSVEADPIPDKSKLLRADPLISAIKSGDFVLLEGAWNDKFKAEATVFTGNGDTHDDQIDAASGALTKLEDDTTSNFEALADE